MSKLLLMEEYGHCGHEVENGRDWSYFDHDREYVALHLSMMKDWDVPTTYYRNPL